MKVIKIQYNHYRDFLGEHNTLIINDSPTKEQAHHMFFRGIRFSVSAGEWANQEEFKKLFNYVYNKYTKENQAIIHIQSSKSYDNVERNSCFFYDKQKNICIPISTCHPSKYKFYTIKDFVELYDKFFDYKSYIPHLKNFIFFSQPNELFPKHINHILFPDNFTPEMDGNVVILDGIKFYINRANDSPINSDFNLRDVWDKCCVVIGRDPWMYCEGDGVYVDIYYRPKSVEIN